MDKVHVYRDQGGEWRWRQVAPNGRTVADSAEGYKAKAGALEAAQRHVGEHRETAGIVVVDGDNG